MFGGLVSLCMKCCCDNTEATMMANLSILYIDTYSDILVLNDIVVIPTIRDVDDVDKAQTRCTGISETCSDCGVHVRQLNLLKLATIS